jgi:hypothetical protein
VTGVQTCALPIYQALVRNVLDGLLPEDAHERCKHRLLVAVQPAENLLAEPVLLDHFDSRQELVEALLASCHIPFYMDGQASRRFRNRPTVDGGLKRLVPRLKLHTGLTGPSVINVCPFPRLVTVATGDHVDIGPHLVEDIYYPLPTLLRLVFQPPEAKDIHRLFNCGRIAAWDYLRIYRPT